MSAQTSKDFTRYLVFVALIVFAVECYSRDNSFQRIVSVGGDITEIIYALGEESRIVAVDTTSVYPQATSDLTKVGYQRALSAEGLLAQQPELLLVTDSAGPSTVIRQVSAAGVAVKTIKTDSSFDGLIEKIKRVASALSVSEKGEQLVASVTRKMHALQTALAPGSAAPTKVVFLLNAGKGPLMAAGHSTSADSVISLAQAANPLSHFEGYKPISAESLIAASPDIILITNRTLNSLGMDGVLAIPGLSLTPAAKNKKIIAMDGLLLLGITPRLPLAIRELHGHIGS